MSMMLKVWPAPKNNMITPMIRPTSPTRLVRNALSAASELGFSSHQWPMSTNEHTPDQLPADEQLQDVVGHDQDEHRGGEQAEEGEVVGEATVALDVLGRVDVHEQRDQRDGEEHHHGEAVDHGADLELDAAGLPPGEGVQDGSDRRPRLALLGRREQHRQGARARSRSRPLRRSAPVDPADPLAAGDDRQHERRRRWRRCRSRPRRGAGACRRTGSATNDAAISAGMIQAFSSEEHALSPSSDRRRRGRCWRGCGR